MLRTFGRLLLKWGVTVWGSFQHPYVTYRSLAQTDPRPLFVQFSITLGFFFAGTLIRLKTIHPIILTLNSGRLFSAAALLYLGSCLLFYMGSRVVGRQPDFKVIALGWGYSLTPTWLWFLATAAFYVFLPPPRHPTVAGWLFSIIYLSFSASLLFWKGMLYYLTLRFGGKLDLLRIAIISAVYLPLLLGASTLLVFLGIFRVPFV